MASKKTMTPAQATRSAARKFRYPKLDNVDPPVFSAKNPLLPDTSDDEINQLHKDYQGQNLAIEVNRFDEGADGRDGDITMIWNGQSVGEPFKFKTPIDTFPVVMELPADNTARAGKYQLGYIVDLMGNKTPSPLLEVNIDTTPPNNNAPGQWVTLPEDVERDGITKEYLDANGGKVVVTVPGNYADPKINDEIVLMFGESIPKARPIGTPFIRTSLVDPIVFDLKREDIVEEGLSTLFYTLADRKGNVGPNSLYKEVNVSLSPAPTGLLPPQIPLAADGIDYADVVAGVRVHIDPYQNWFSQDRVVVNFDGVDHSAQPMPMEGAIILLPYALVYNGDYGPKESRVTYKIVRGLREYPETVGIDFDVDLRTPGPDPKDPPEIIHPDLTIPTIRGAVSTTPNELDASLDADQQVTAVATIYNGHATGQYAQLYWNGEEVPGAGGRYDVQGDEDPAFEIPFTIPWAMVAESGNSDAIPVHYVVGHDANDNIYHSRPRNVKVSGIKIVLPEPKFYLDPKWGVVNCPSLRFQDGELFAEIAVPGGDLRLANQLLTFEYQGWEDDQGSVEKAGTYDTFTYTPNDDQARDGFSVFLPYEGALRETFQDWGSILFKVSIDGNAASSERHLVSVELNPPGEKDFCPNPPENRLSD